MQMRNASRVGATCAIGGAALLFIGTYLHPMGADPNDPAAAFAEYAGDRLWVASHLVQLAGVTAMMGALLFLTEQLKARTRSSVARIAAVGAIVSLVLAAALQAVDGIALKSMVDAWAAAPASQKEGVFQAALAVRQLGPERKSVEDVAYRLGFADASGFQKAFRRWTGNRPADYSRTLWKFDHP